MESRLWISNPVGFYQFFNRIDNSIKFDSIISHNSIKFPSENFRELRPRSDCSVFVQKRREKPPNFHSECSEFPQKRRFLKTYLINVNTQKRRFLKTLQYPTMSFTKLEQCEHTKQIFWLRICYLADQCERSKTDVFPSILYKNGIM